ncbi:hydrolase TatD [bacterium (Candidatus Gribaldobacteria) CG_4_10_14_0_8_um_filter_33_9]|uniref:Hydrolase TatD n=1 Tax=bacterium (Candidatus Gribaldobacteria) CG_4_10_14_0_8_um_filter_33_9 TaxID=2014266 RepID=A0A2M7RNN5_9BACT|nr:MAG: hydrolase TatD [bacterium (Candidatus Gribaldobacteria) CG_4_10_14_0_8_um_filter_33_9]
MLIDTHSHLNFNAYKNDSEEIIKNCLDDDVWMINVGSQYSTSCRAVRIAEKYLQGVYAAVGLHPDHLETKKEIEYKTKEEKFDYKKYRELALSEKVKAIGEIGLDYWCQPKNKIKQELFKEKQKNVLLKQLNLAQKLNLPVIFHCRKAHGDLLEILKSKFQNSNVKPKGVVHCFTGNWEVAQRYLEMGLYLGFNGIIFKLNLDKVIKKIPLERISIETDCPYLSPPAYQKQRNDPLSLKYIIQKIAEIKNLSYKKIAETTTENAKKLFNI